MFKKVMEERSTIQQQYSDKLKDLKQSTKALSTKFKQNLDLRGVMAEIADRSTYRDQLRFNCNQTNCLIHDTFDYINRVKKQQEDA